MIDLKEIPREILMDMRDKYDLREPLAKAGEGADDSKLENMTPEEFFDEWCNYEGLVYYGPRLRELWETLRAMIGEG